jgi:RNA polymerase sigma-70 factor (ECF subfamily)
MEKKKKEFSKIFDNYVAKIYRFIFLKVSSQDVAQDLCSETFLRCWETFQKNQGSESEIQNVQAFLYQIARNLITDHYREKGRTEVVSVEALPIIDPTQELEEKMALNSDLEQIKIALADLKDDYQNVIIWHYLEDLSISEVAKMLDRTEGATRVLLHRALSNLRQRLNLS